MAENKLYEILGVPRGADEQTIKKSYKKLAKEFHPDKNPTAGDKFKDISFAYEVLSDSKKRRVYDQYGLKGVQEGVGEGRMSTDDIFSDLFGCGGGLFGGLAGFGGGMGRRKPTRGEDTVHHLKVTLEDMYNGKTTKLQQSKKVKCSACGGLGGAEGAVVRCRGCRGVGMKIVLRQLVPGLSQQIQTPCEDCQGTGEVINEKDRCTTCNGKKIISEQKILEVHIDKGMQNNQKILFRGESDQMPGCQAGDVVILLQQKPHDVFQRNNDHLHMTTKIGLAEALCGMDIIVRHLDGRHLHVKHPAGHIIRPGDIKAIAGEGMPQYRNPFEKGNLYIKFEVTFPEDHFASEQVLKQLESVFPPRPKLKIPKDSMEVDLEEYDPDHNTSSSRTGKSYSSDEDEMQGQPGLSCAQQ
ncbi:dnaJ homolog subfamily A member 2 [Cephus cinctus]|uniref:DnaJ homolog subfamily A member 2 n=1 Tax=Cephus cinctus TaxID=211228 RepID=A0AAJ7C944_CEPCN|nr:dnaJ homolog subfamily A member 2 [Cephus cinctus]